MTVVLTPGGTIAAATQQAEPARRPVNSIVSGNRTVPLTAEDGVTPVISFEQIYRSQPAVASVVNKILRQISTLPLNVYRHVSDDEAKKVPRDHPVQQLIDKPAPRKSSADLKQWLARPYLIHGNSLTAKFRGNGPGTPPTNVLPLRWQYVSAWAAVGGPVEMWGTTQLGEWRWLGIDDAVHIAWESDLGEIGVSPLEQLGVTVKLEDAAQRYQAASFRNGTRPSGAVVLPKEARLDEQQRREMRDDIREMHEGVDNAFRVALLSGGATWQPMSFSAVEAQLIEQRRRNLEDVCIVYDMPPQLIGDLSRGSLSSVAELHRMLYVTLLRPHLAFIEDSFKAQVIDPEDEWSSEDLFIRFDLGDVLRGSRSEEITAAAQAFLNGLMTLNEVRKTLNMPLIGDPGDPANPANIPHIPANNMAALTGGTATGGPGPIGNRSGPDIPSTA